MTLNPTSHVCPTTTLPVLPSLAEAPPDAAAPVAVAMLDVGTVERFQDICRRLGLDPTNVIRSAVERFSANPPNASRPLVPLSGTRRVAVSLPTRLVAALEARAKDDKVTLTAALGAILNHTFTGME